MAAFIDEIIMFLFGMYFTAVGQGWIPGPGATEAARQALLARSGKTFRIIGPLLAVIAVLLAVGELLAA